MAQLETNLVGAFNHKDLFTALDLSVKRLKEQLQDLSTMKDLHFRLEGVGTGITLRIVFEAAKPGKVNEDSIH